MSETFAEREPRVTPLEFFFGLVFVFAITQVTTLMSVDPTAGGLLRSMLVLAALWWAWAGYAWLTNTMDPDEGGVRLAVLARDAYAYLHLPMVAGIVLFALGLKKTIANVDSDLATIPALGLTGGVALYFAAHVCLRLRIGGGFGHGRPTAVALLLALVPVALTAPALLALALVCAVCTVLIVYEALRYRESRARIRQTRQAPA